MRELRKTRALIRYERGGVSGLCDVRAARPAENVPVFRPADASGLKPSLAAIPAEPSRRVNAALWGHMYGSSNFVTSICRDYLLQLHD